MRKAQSFQDLEELAYEESLKEGKEKLFLTNGRLFLETGKNGKEDKVNIDSEKESYFLNSCPGVFIYSYHTHITGYDMQNKPEPPRFQDFCSDSAFRKRAAQKGRRIISRVIEKNGIWQYSWTSKIPYPQKIWMKPYRTKLTM